MARKPYPTDVTDEQWAFVEPYVTLMILDAPQRRYDLREVFNAALWLVKTGGQWRMMPHDMPPWPAVYQQLRRWIEAGVFDEIVHDLRAMLRVMTGREPDPTAAVFDARVLRSSPESGGVGRAGYDGHKRTKGSKVHAAVDVLGHLLALHVTPADTQERDEAGALAAMAQEASHGKLEMAYVDQGYTGKEAAEEARGAGDIELTIVKAPEAKRGFLLLPRRWVVERSFAWMARCRRLARDFERLPEVLAGLHWLAFAGLLLRRWFCESA